MLRSHQLASVSVEKQLIHIQARECFPIAGMQFLPPTVSHLMSHMCCPAPEAALVNSGNVAVLISLFCNNCYVLSLSIKPLKPTKAILTSFILFVCFTTISKVQILFLLMESGCFC